MPALSRRGNGSTVNTSELAAMATEALLRPQHQHEGVGRVSGGGGGTRAERASAGNGAAAAAAAGSTRSSGATTSAARHKRGRDDNNDESGAGGGSASKSFPSSVAVAVPSFRAPRTRTPLALTPNIATTVGSSSGPLKTQVLMPSNARNNNNTNICVLNDSNPTGDCQPSVDKDGGAALVLTSNSLRVSPVATTTKAFLSSPPKSTSPQHDTTTSPATTAEALGSGIGRCDFVPASQHSDTVVAATPQQRHSAERREGGIRQGEGDVTAATALEEEGVASSQQQQAQHVAAAVDRVLAMGENDSALPPMSSNPPLPTPSPPSLPNLTSPLPLLHHDGGESSVPIVTTAHCAYARTNTNATVNTRCTSSNGHNGTTRLRHQSLGNTTPTSSSHGRPAATSRSPPPPPSLASSANAPPKRTLLVFGAGKSATATSATANNTNNKPDTVANATVSTVFTTSSTVANVVPPTAVVFPSSSSSVTLASNAPTLQPTPPIGKGAAAAADEAFFDNPSDFIVADDGKKNAILEEDDSYLHQQFRNATATEDSVSVDDINMFLFAGIGGRPPPLPPSSSLAGCGGGGVVGNVTSALPPQTPSPLLYPSTATAASVSIAPTATPTMSTAATAAVAATSAPSLAPKRTLLTFGSSSVATKSTAAPSAVAAPAANASAATLSGVGVVANGSANSNSTAIGNNASSARTAVVADAKSPFRTRPKTLLKFGGGGGGASAAAAAAPSATNTATFTHPTHSSSSVSPTTVAEGGCSNSNNTTNSALSPSATTYPTTHHSGSGGAAVPTVGANTWTSSTTSGGVKRTVLFPSSSSSSSTAAAAAAGRSGAATAAGGAQVVVPPLPPPQPHTHTTHHAHQPPPSSSSSSWAESLSMAFNQHNTHNHNEKKKAAPQMATPAATTTDSATTTTNNSGIPTKNSAAVQGVASGHAAGNQSNTNTNAGTDAASMMTNPPALAANVLPINVSSSSSSSLSRPAFQTRPTPRPYTPLPPTAAAAAATHAPPNLVVPVNNAFPSNAFPPASSSQHSNPLPQAAPSLTTSAAVASASTAHGNGNGGVFQTNGGGAHPSNNNTFSTSVASAPMPPPPPPAPPSDFYGLPPIARDLYAARGVTRGYEWQEHVLTRPDVVEGKNFVYSLPTSGGKTFVAEVLLMRTLLAAMAAGNAALAANANGFNRNSNNSALAAGGNPSCLFVLPFVSLAEEKCKALQPFADALHFNVEGYYGVQGRFPAPAAPTIFVCTIEKANSLYNHLCDEGRHKKIKCVVVDELHMVGENRRGPVLELLLTKIRLASPAAQLVGMSATVPNLQQIADWMGAGCYVGTFRPVPLKEHVVQGGMVLERSTEDPTQMLPNPRALPSATMPNDEHMHIMHLLTEVPNCSTLVFCATRDQCLQYARQIVKTLERMRIGPRPEVGQMLADLRGLGHEARNLSELVPYGVAYHTGALSLEERDIVEKGFKARQITILCCTSTLAAGVNLPARRVIFKTPYVAKEFLSKSMYTQMCGRAGRAGYDVFGESFLILSRRDQAQGMRLVFGSLSPVHSGLFAEQHGLARALMESLNVGVFATTSNAKVWTRALLANFTHQPIPDKLLQDAMALVESSSLFKKNNGNNNKKRSGSLSGLNGASFSSVGANTSGNLRRAASPTKQTNGVSGGVHTALPGATPIRAVGGDSVAATHGAAPQLMDAPSPSPRAQKRDRSGITIDVTATTVAATTTTVTTTATGQPQQPLMNEVVHTLASLSQRRSGSLHQLLQRSSSKDGGGGADEAEGDDGDERDPIDILIEGSIIALESHGFLTVEQITTSNSNVSSSELSGASSGGTPFASSANKKGEADADADDAGLYGMLSLVGGGGIGGMGGGGTMGGLLGGLLAPSPTVASATSAVRPTPTPSAPINISQPKHIPVVRQYKLQLTPFGSASVKACFGVEEALLVRDEMSLLQDEGVILSDDLEICYLVTPVMEPIECNWALFARQLASLSVARQKIAASVGLDAAFIQQRAIGLNFGGGGGGGMMMMGAAASKVDSPIPPAAFDANGKRIADPTQRKLYVCRRYFAALALSDILNEVPASTIESRYGLTATQQTALLRASSIFSNNMVAFCGTMSWFNIEALLSAFVRRLGFGVKPDIIPLMEINGVKASKARVLFAAGFRSPALIAASNPQDLFKKVKESNPKDNKAAKFFTLKSAVVAIREANVVLQRQLREKKGELEEMEMRARMA